MENKRFSIIVVIICILVSIFGLIVLIVGNKQDEMSQETVPIVTDQSFTAGSARADHIEANIKNVPAPAEEPEYVPEPEAPPASPAEELTSPENEAPVAETTEELKLETLAKDPYAMYIVDEEWMKEIGGFAVERDAKLYSVASFVPVDTIIKYDVGFNTVGGSPNASLFRSDWRESTIPTEEPFCYITCGDIPIMEIDRNEEVRGYGTDILGLYKTEFVGYTVDVTRAPDETFPVINHNLTAEDEKKAKVRKDQVGVYDLGDNQVADFRKLDYGQEYSIQWFVGTEYFEERKLADCKAYRSFDKNHAPDPIILKGTLTKNGYATFDLSQLEPGTYITSQWDAVFEVH